MSHDYRPEWDYEVDRRPLKAVRDLVDLYLFDDSVATSRGAHGEVLRELGIERPTVHYVTGLAEGKHLAKFVSGTSSAPVIVVDTRAMRAAEREYGVSLDTVVESTLLHEYGHAFVESVGAELDDEEGVVERFAHYVWETRDYEGGVRDLRIAAEGIVPIDRGRGGDGEIEARP